MISLFHYRYSSAISALSVLILAALMGCDGSGGGSGSDGDGDPTAQLTVDSIQLGTPISSVDGEGTVDGTLFPTNFGEITITVDSSNPSGYMSVWMQVNASGATISHYDWEIVGWQNQEPFGYLSYYDEVIDIDPAQGGYKVRSFGNKVRYDSVSNFFVSSNHNELIKVTAWTVDGYFTTAFFGLSLTNDPASVVPPPDVVDVPCLEFDGSITAITLSKLLDTEGAFDLSVWFKSSTMGQTSHLIYQGDGSTSPGNITLNVLFISGTLTIGFNGVQSAYGSANQYLDGEWHIFHLSHDGNGTAQGWVDSNSSIDIVGSTHTTSTTTRIGSNGAGTSVFTGLMTLFSHNDGKLPMQEGSGLPYDVSRNNNHPTVNTATWTTADDIPSWNLDGGFWVLEDLYTVTEPTDGWVASNVALTDLADVRDLIATMIHEAKTDKDTFTVTGHSSDKVFNPNTATLGEVLNCAGTIANDLWTGFTGYTITEPSGGRVRTFDPTDPTLTLQQLANVLATFMHDATN